MRLPIVRFRLLSVVCFSLVAFFLFTGVRSAFASRKPSMKVKAVYINGNKMDGNVLFGLINIDGTTMLSAGHSVKFVVEINNIKGDAWLGATLRNSDGTEFDFKPIEINDKEGEYSISGTVSGKLALSSEGWGNTNVNYIKYTIALWSKEVSLSQCKAKNGEACIYCQRNGFHMEEQLANADWALLGFLANF